MLPISALHLGPLAVNRGRRISPRFGANPCAPAEDSRSNSYCVTLPAVIRRNAQDPAIAARYRELLSNDPLDAWVETRLRDFHLETSLSALQTVPHDILPTLAKEATEQWTAQFNPITLTEAEFLELYEASWSD